MRLLKTLYTTTASLIFLSMLAACAAPPTRSASLASVGHAVNKPDILTKVTSGGTKLEIEGVGSPQCRNPNKGPGCIHVATDDVAIIKFRLTASPNWNFTRLEICKGNEKASRVCNISFWTQDEFLATDDTWQTIVNPDKNGMIDLKQIDNSLDEFVLLDLNRYAQEYFYRVEVCSAVNPANCLWTDPPLENGGMN